MDQRYCKYVIHPKGGKPYQCIRSPLGDGYCTRHGQWQKAKAEQENVLYVYSVPIGFSVSDYMPKELRVRRYDNKGIVAMNRARIPWESPKVMYFKSRLSAMQWKRSNMKIDVVHLREQLQRATADSQRERLMRLIGSYEDAISAIDRELTDAAVNAALETA